MNNKKKDFFYIALSIAILFVIFVGIPYLLLFFLNKDAREVRKIAELNAKDYIKNKYNIEARILNTENKMNCSPYPLCSSSGMSIIKMKYHKKIFYVYITNSERNIYGYDNYQYNKIQKKLIQLLNKETKFKPYNYSVEYGKYVNTKDKINGLIDIYYDKTNIEEIIKYYRIKINSNYIRNENLEKINLDNLHNIYNNNADIHLVKFKTIKDYKKVINSEKYDHLSDEELYDFAPYIEKEIILDGKLTEKNDYSKIKKIDDMYFMLLTNSGYQDYSGRTSLKIDVNKTNYKWKAELDDDEYAKDLIIDNYLINLEDNIDPEKNNNIYLFVKKDKIEKLNSREKELDFLINNGFGDTQKNLDYSFPLYGDYYAFFENIKKVADKKIIVSLHNPYNY